MKRIVWIFIFAIFGLAAEAFADTSTVFPLSSPKKDVLIFEIRIPLEQFQLKDVTTTSGLFQRLVWKDLQGIEGKSGLSLIGLPETPIHTSTWAFPLASTIADIKVEPFGKSRVFKSTRLYPVQGLNAEDYDDSLTQAGITFAHNPNLWLNQGNTKVKALLHRNLAVADSNIKSVSIELSDYEPASSTLILYESYRVKIRFTPLSVCYRNIQQEKPAYDALADPVLLGQIPAVVQGSANLSTWANHPCVELQSHKEIVPSELLVIYPPEFAEAAAQFQLHKQSLGISTAIVSTDSIPKTINGSLQAEDIKAYVKQNYESNFHRLRWLLLLGDVDSIPSFYDKNCLSGINAKLQGCRNSGYYAVHNSGDAYYGQLIGSLPDEIPSIGIGRLPARIGNLGQPDAEALAIVQKIIQYESGIGFKPDFFYRTILAANLEGMTERNKQIAKPGTYAAVVEEKMAPVLVQALAVEPLRIYKSTLGPPVTHWTADKPISDGIIQAGMKADVLSPWEAGSLLTLHQGHGLWNGWEAPNFNTEQIKGLQPPSDGIGSLVLSINCHAGMFDSETVNLPSNQPTAQTYPLAANYFGESMIRDANGSVAFLGASRESNTTRNKVFGPILIQGLFGTESSSPRAGRLRLGDWLNWARAQTFQSAPSDPRLGFNAQAREHILIYNLLGDPSLMLRRGAIESKFRLQSITPVFESGQVIGQKLQLSLLPNTTLPPELNEPGLQPRVVAIDPAHSLPLATADLGANGDFTLDIPAPWPSQIHLIMSGRDLVTKTLDVSLP